MEIQDLRNNNSTEHPNARMMGCDYFFQKEMDGYIINVKVVDFGKFAEEYNIPATFEFSISLNVGKDIFNLYLVDRTDRGIEETEYLLQRAFDRMMGNHRV